VRKLDAIQSARLDRSIAQFGICLPILIDNRRHIVHGHGIWEAARRAGLDQVPVIEVGHLPPEKLRLLAIALNRLGETGRWDEEVLAQELEELIELDEDIIVTGFEPAEIDALLLDEDGVEESADQLPLVPVVPVSQLGDLWRLGDHLLLQGDALDPGSYRHLLAESEEARIVLTDVPFNVPNRGHTTSKAHHREFAMAHGEMSREEFAAFNLTWMGLAANTLIDGGLLATFIDWRSIEIVLAAGRESDLNLLNIVVWHKTNGGQGGLWRSQHELLPILKKGLAAHVNNIQMGRHGRWRSNVWTYPGGSSLGSEARARSDDHPTVKPRALLEDALLDISNRGEIVLDPFLGSGSTLLAAQTTGRLCRAIEIDGRYCDVCIERWQELTEMSAVLEETGETFAEVGERRARSVGRTESGHGQEADG
jgi:DNA modification methylase